MKSVEKKEKVTLKINKESLIIGLILLLFILSLVRSFYMNNINAEIFNKVEAIKEEQRPASLQLVKIIDSSCTDCFDIDQLTDALQTFNVNITNIETLEFTSSNAKDLINKFDIKAIPVLIVSGETDKSNVANLWQLLGKKFDGTVVSQPFPPYKNLMSGNIEGLVSLTMITDNSCTTCYDVSIFKQILPRFGVKIKSELTYDVNSAGGKELLNKYNITKAPIILLSPDAKIYSNLVQAWGQVGSIEKDGWFVFRAAEAMGAYKDISTGQIIQP